MIIAIWEKPATGNVQRTCRLCGEPYVGWNYVRCESCVKVRIEVAHMWQRA
jgi:hypothetical protein